MTRASGRAHGAQEVWLCAPGAAIRLSEACYPGILHSARRDTRAAAAAGEMIAGAPADPRGAEPPRAVTRGRTEEAAEGLAWLAGGAAVERRALRAACLASADPRRLTMKAAPRAGGGAAGAYDPATGGGPPKLVAVIPLVDGGAAARALAEAAEVDDWLALTVGPRTAGEARAERG